ncbi:MAG: DUF427 domain-containing protein [Bradyrhizobium sp.]
MNDVQRPQRGLIRNWLSRIFYPNEADVGGNRMMKAVWNGTVIAESAKTEIVEGNHYFPPEALRKEFFQPSDTQTVCPWKGTARYYSIVVGNKVNTDAAWYYPEPKSAASQIAGKVAFWKGVRVEATQ